MRTILILLLLSPLLVAQNSSSPATAPKDLAVSGIVRDKGTGQPLANFKVYTDTHSKWIGNAIASGPDSKRIESTTDANGRYRLSGLLADQYQITARDSQGRTKEDVTRRVVVSDHDMEKVNFDVVLDGSLEGKVIDENGDPVAGAQVILAAREYFLGSIGYYVQSFGATRTNDRGEYRVSNLVAGRAYLMVVDGRTQFGLSGPQAETPLNPKLRRQVFTRTWYSNSISGEGATDIIVRPGEVRQSVNITLKKSPSYCVEGTTSVEGAAAATSFDLKALQPKTGLSSRGGTFAPDLRLQTGDDGAFRICDLSPGAYRLSANNMLLPKPAGVAAFGTTTIAIVDQDLKDLKLNALAAAPVRGEVVLDGPAPKDPITAKAYIGLDPLLRARFRAGDETQARADIPGTFVLPSVMMDDYLARAFVNSPGLYVKDVTWGGQSVLNVPVHVREPADFRLVIGQDAANLTATVADKDGNPVSDINVLVFPASVASEGALAQEFMTGRTDQNGQYAANNLPPGRYYVAATEDTFDAAVGNISKLWNLYRSFKEVELPPNGQLQLSLQPLTETKQSR